MSFSQGSTLISTMNQMKPLQSKSKNLKTQLKEFMISHNLKSCSVADKTCTLYERKCRKPMTKKLLTAQLKSYEADSQTKESIQQFLSHVQSHINQNCVIKPAIRIK